MKLETENSDKDRKEQCSKVWEVALVLRRPITNLLLTIKRQFNDSVEDQMRRDSNCLRKDLGWILRGPLWQWKVIGCWNSFFRKWWNLLWRYLRREQATPLSDSLKVVHSFIQYVFNEHLCCARNCLGTGMQLWRKQRPTHVLELTEVGEEIDTEQMTK